MDSKIKRVVRRDHIDEKQAKAKIEKVEKERANHCMYFTHRQWKDLGNYDLYIKSDVLGLNPTADLILQIVRGKREE